VSAPSSTSPVTGVTIVMTGAAPLVIENETVADVVVPAASVAESDSVWAPVASPWNTQAVFEDCNAGSAHASVPSSCHSTSSVLSSASATVPFASTSPGASASPSAGATMTTVGSGLTGGAALS